MKRILASSLLACLALAGRAAAGDRCDLDGVPGAEIVVRYPREHTDRTEKHDNRHVLFKANPESVVQGATLGHADPRIIAVGTFTSEDEDTGCDVLWEERDPDDPHEPPDHPLRVGITQGFLQAGPEHFVVGTERPPVPWEVAGAYDLTGDQRTDVVWWNPVTGAAMLWARTTNGWVESEVAGELPPMLPTDPPEISPRPPYTAIARLVPDQAPGIVWQDPMNGGPVLYYPTKWNGVHLILSEPLLVTGLPTGGHSLAAVSDADGDGVDDHLLERRTSDDMLVLCPMNGLVVDSTCALFLPGPIATASGPLGWFVVGPR